MAGLVFGVAAMARLTTILGLPFFVLVGSGGSVWRRGLSAALGAAIPVALLLAYNLASSGQLFEPGYDYLYQTETVPIPAGLLAQVFPSLQAIGYHPGTWNAEDLRYLPQNLLIMLAWLPTVQPQCGLEGLFSTTCALVRPDPLGMSLLLTSPAYLLAIPALLAGWRDRLVIGATVAVAADRRGRPGPLQPGLGPVRLPLQQRLRPVRPDPGHAGRGAARAAACGRGPGGAVGPHQRVGRLLGRGPGLVRRLYTRRDVEP